MVIGQCGITPSLQNSFVWKIWFLTTDYCIIPRLSHQPHKKLLFLKEFDGFEDRKGAERILWEVEPEMGKRFRIPRNSVFRFPRSAENSRNGKWNSKSRNSAEFRGICWTENEMTSVNFREAKLVWFINTEHLFWACSGTKFFTHKIKGWAQLEFHLEFLPLEILTTWNFDYLEFRTNWNF